MRSPPIVVDARKRTNRERPRANEYDVCLAKRKGAVGSIGGGGGGGGGVAGDASAALKPMPCRKSSPTIPAAQAGTRTRKLR